ncbi:MAG: alpha/beta hydrolase [Planctomycetota bacterium]
MRQIPLWFAAATGLLTGCGQETIARWMIEYNTLPGRVRLAMAGDPDKLLRRGEIDTHLRLPAPDGTEIDVWTIRGRTPAVSQPTADPQGTVLLIHGLWDSKVLMLPTGRELAKLGYDVILPDLRAHGASGGTYVTWGAQETDDLRAVVDELLRRGTVHEPLYVVGFSMGGGIAIQYAAADRRCRAVMALAPVASAERILRRIVRPLKLGMRKGDVDAAFARAGGLAGVDLNQASAVDAGRHLHCPLLLVHGTLDWMVPHDHSRLIHAAAPGPKDLITVPRKTHTGLIFGRAKWNARHLDALARTAR